MDGITHSMKEINGLTDGNYCINIKNLVLIYKHKQPLQKQLFD